MSAAINVHATNLAPAEDKTQNGHSAQDNHDEQEHPPHPDDDKSPEEIRQAYEELRIEVEPAEAMIDPNVQFEHPEVSLRAGGASGAVASSACVAAPVAPPTLGDTSTGD